MGFLSSDLYKEIRKTHDAVIVLQLQMSSSVTRADFDVKMVDVRSRITAIESRQTATEVEIQKLKDKRTN